MPLPQRGVQSASVVAFAPDGQQPSAVDEVVSAACSHAASHVAALPLSESRVHGSPSSHSACVGQAGANSSVPGSQVSPRSFCTTPSPQRAGPAVPLPAPPYAPAATLLPAPAVVLPA